MGDGGDGGGATSIGPRCPANVAAAQSAARRRSEDCAECQRYEQGASHLSLPSPSSPSPPSISFVPVRALAGSVWLCLAPSGSVWLCLVLDPAHRRHATTACRSRSSGLSWSRPAFCFGRCEAKLDAIRGACDLLPCWCLSAAGRTVGKTWRLHCPVLPLLGASIGAWSPVRIPGIPCNPCPLLVLAWASCGFSLCKRLPEIEAAPPTTPLNAALELGASHRLTSSPTTRSHVPDVFWGFRSGLGLNAGTGGMALGPMYVQFWLRP